MYNLKVVIIGAGIGGLVAGIALQKSGYTVEIYDKVNELRPAGAGISLWSNGVKVLNWLGLGDEMASIGGSMNRMEYLDPQGKRLNHIDLQPLVERVGQRPYPVARTDLQRILLKGFGEDDVRLGFKCVGVEQDDVKVTAIFENGHQTTGDLLIAADGIHSGLRSYVAGTEITPRYADYVNWNGLVPASTDIAPHDVWQIYVGEGKRASMMPVGDHRFYYFFGVPMAQGTRVDPKDRQNELAHYFTGWATPVQHLINHLNPLEINRLDICDLDPFTPIVRGRVVLLGDAAHASTPTLGQGGCQAMEDAEILCRFLVTTNLGVSDALHRYERDRLERTHSLVLRARKRADVIYAKDPQVTQQWYEHLSLESEEDVVNALAKVILSGPFK